MPAAIAIVVGLCVGVVGVAAYAMWDTYRERNTQVTFETIEFLDIPGADEALLGYVWRCGQEPFAVYDRDKLVAQFVTDGMTEDEASEWISFNIEDAWVGPGTPGVLQRI